MSYATDGKTRYELLPIGKDKFRLLDNEIEVTFVRNEQGEVIERLRESDGFVSRNKKVKETAAK